MPGAHGPQHRTRRGLGVLPPIPLIFDQSAGTNGECKTSTTSARQRKKTNVRIDNPTSLDGHTDLGATGHAARTTRATGGPRIIDDDSKRYAADNAYANRASAPAPRSEKQTKSQSRLRGSSLADNSTRAFTLDLTQAAQRFTLEAPIVTTAARMLAGGNDRGRVERLTGAACSKMSESRQLVYTFKPPDIKSSSTKHRKSARNTA